MVGRYVRYADIPDDARKVLDEIYGPHGVEVWWNSPNRLLVHYTGDVSPDTPLPRDHPTAALQLANAIAGGVFF